MSDPNEKTDDQAKTDAPPTEESNPPKEAPAEGDKSE